MSSARRVVVVGEGLDQSDEGVVFSVVSRGRFMMGMCAFRQGADARCASLALSHLSLSLSLFV
jgi:hypothetical protein